jgi:mycothiol synthase
MKPANEGHQSRITVRQIQRLTHSDALALARIRREVDPDDAGIVNRSMTDMDRLVSRGGRAWILRRGRELAGFASVMPAPGLPGLYELEGFIAPASRRQGLGSKLLAVVISQLNHSGAQQLSYPVSTLSSPAGRFLIENGFYDEHVEDILVLDDLASLPTLELDDGFALLTLDRGATISHFRRLYQAAFADQAWYQPYESDQEVGQELVDPEDILFLAERDRPVGFLWLRWPALQTAEIEPLGLLPSYWGQGLGRQLMVAGLHQAARQGANQVQVAAWRANKVALTLYQRLGFRLYQQRHYLAYDL